MKDVEKLKDQSDELFINVRDVTLEEEVYLFTLSHLETMYVQIPRN